MLCQTASEITQSKKQPLVVDRKEFTPEAILSLTKNAYGKNDHLAQCTRNILNSIVQDEGTKSDSALMAALSEVEATAQRNAMDPNSEIRLRAQELLKTVFPKKDLASQKKTNFSLRRTLSRLVPL